MISLTSNSFDLINNFFQEKARLLEKYLFEYYFKGGSKTKVISELRKYQNDDGGFGHGLEPDFRLPYSSPMSASVGIRILSEIGGYYDAKEIIKSAIGYIESSFDKQRNGWFAVPKEVNDYPHAPWWHYDEQKGMTVIDKNWGNPSAEILAYLYKYREYVNKINLDCMIEYAVQYIGHKQEFQSENELFCYIKLFDVLPDNLKERLSSRITLGISQVIEYDREKWNEYVPMPLNFVPTPDKFSFGIEESAIQENLNFYIELIKNNGVINPPWGDSFYHESLGPAYNEWKGVLTLKVLKILDNYGLIER